MVVPRESSEKVRDRLIDAAIGQLASAGMRGLTHRKVEQRAGVSQGLAQYHFGNLDGLIDAVLHRLVEVELGPLVDGILLHELSAPSAELADRVPAMLLAGGAAAAYLPGEEQ